jgi:hypothetical protein
MLADLQQYLADNGVGTIATNLFATYMPPSPDNAVAIIATGGPEPIEISGIKSPTFQVLIRNADYATGEAKMATIRNLLQALKNTTIGNTYFYFILLTSEGGHIGRDDVGRDEFSLNFLCRTR